MIRWPTTTTPTNTSIRAMKKFPIGRRSVVKTPARDTDAYMDYLAWLFRAAPRCRQKAALLAQFRKGFEKACFSSDVTLTASHLRPGHPVGRLLGSGPTMLAYRAKFVAPTFVQRRSAF